MTNPLTRRLATFRASFGTPSPARMVATALTLGLFAAAMWFAWLGWDHDYYEVNGVPQGPYRAWQVIGCGLSIAVATALAYLRTPRFGAMLMMAGAAVVGFAVPWSVDAGRTDETGMWGVGLFLILVGGGLGLVVLLTVLKALSDPRFSATQALVLGTVLTLVALLVYPLIAIVPLLATGAIFALWWLPQRRGRRARHAG